MCMQAEALRRKYPPILNAQRSSPFISIKAEANFWACVKCFRARIFTQGKTAGKANI